MKDEIRQRAQVVLTELSRTMQAIVEDPAWGEELKTARHFERVSGINRKLAWQIVRVARATTPVDEIGNIPKQKSIEIFLAAALDRGVPDAKLQEARSAYRAMERQAESDAGGRKSYETLLTHLSDMGRKTISPERLRSAYRENKHIWGIESDLNFTTDIVAPSLSQTPGKLTLLHLKGIASLRSLGRTKILVYNRNLLEESPEPIGSLVTPAMQYDAETCAVHAYCSGSLPKLTRITTGDTLAIYAELPFDGTLTFTLVFATMMELDWSDDVTQDFLTTRLPTGKVVVDRIMHRELEATSLSTTTSLGAGAGAVGYLTEPIELPIESDGDSPSDRARPMPKFPNYRDLVERSMKVVGWDPADFEYFRSSIAHPPPGITLLADIPIKACED